MELKVSAEKPGFSSSDGSSDPEEQELSEGEDEDDDRNHKHRRRETNSQSFEGSSNRQGLTIPYRKRDNPFHNDYSYREGQAQSSEAWRSYGYPPDRDFGSRFEKKRLYQGSFSRTPTDFSLRIRGNQALPSEVGASRGRGREHFSWGIRDPTLGLTDVASQIIQTGPSALFAGRGLPNIANAQRTSWPAFGLVPGVPNGGLDSVHPLALQGALGQAIGPQMNLVIPRQRCRDFEERGFCLRGDMCPMEHGVNRIVVDDFQSLSRFNLPVSVPGPQLLGTASGQGSIPLLNNKGWHAKSGKPGVSDEGFGLNGGVPGVSLGLASDVYDPDQPLLTNDNPKTSAPLLALKQPNMDGPGSVMENELSSRQKNESYDGLNSELSLTNATTAGSPSSAAWGRIGSSRCNVGGNGKPDSVGTSPSYLEQNAKSEEALNMGLHDIQSRGKRTHTDGNDLLVKELSMKLHSDSARNIRKPSRKTLRTLFVNGIPPNENKREALLMHFRKFGEVIDIYIPINSDRAFVQFSKREEAEIALKSPDAVMGNRFIRLHWANRDNIPDVGKQGLGGVPIAPTEMMINPPPSRLLDKEKENPHIADENDGSIRGFVAQQPAYDYRKPLVANISKAPALQQKRSENLELLKEELRKKQQILDQKRNEFKRQLDKLEKQAVGSRDGTVSDRINKNLQGDMANRPHKADTSKLPAATQDNMTLEKATSAEPMAASAPAEPMAASAPAEPMAASAPAEPMAASAPAEPMAASAPAEPMAASAPAEPMAASAPAEPMAASAPAEPMAASAPAEPMAASAPAEPTAASAPAEPTAASAPAEPTAASAPAEPTAASTSALCPAIALHKLDNGPTSFRILSPLPAGFAEVSALEEHFSIFGGLSSVELEESEIQETNPPIASGVSARICFSMRQFAERAFSHGKSWKGHKLQFSWLPSVKADKEGTGCGNPSSSDMQAYAGVELQPGGDDASIQYESVEGSGTGDSRQLNTEADEVSAEQNTDLKSCPSFPSK